jgi:hypothetical protein
VPERTYIALGGPSEWASFNALWAVLKHSDFVPDRVVIVTFKEDLAKANQTATRMRVLLEAYGRTIAPELVEADDTSIEAVCDAFKGLYAAEKAAGTEVAMDVTNGRKMMALCAIKAWKVKELKHLYYLYIQTLKDVDHPYMCIPLGQQHLCDMLEGEHG